MNAKYAHLVGQDDDPLRASRLAPANDAADCDADLGPWLCTRLAGHEPPHVAWGGLICAAWPDGGPDIQGNTWDDQGDHR